MMSNVAIKIGPGDHGRAMSLAEFDMADAEEGRRYELSRGVITVVDVPSEDHFAIVDYLRQFIAVYRATHRGQIHRVAGGSDCKILLPQLNSERHPDIAIYMTVPDDQGENLWANWIPEVVIEVVSPGSKQRDYEEKREEYFQFGIKEYWIVDDEKQQITVLKRWGGQWRERVLQPGDKYQTKLLPGFELNCEEVLAAGASD